MTTAYHTMYRWARKTTSSFFGELRHTPAERCDHDHGNDAFAYQLRHWPDLPFTAKTADVLRTLSVMSHRPVNRRWILATSRMKDAQVDVLLERLRAQGALTVTELKHTRAAPARLN